MKLNIEMLEAAREYLGFKIRDFGPRIGVSHQTYYNLLQNRHDPTLKTLTIIAKKLEIKDPLKLIKV